MKPNIKTASNHHTHRVTVPSVIHGDKLKLMAGAELATLDGGGNGGDYDGITWLSGFRFSF